MPTCSECRYWDATHTVSGAISGAYGECRRYPSSPVPKRIEGIGGILGESEFVQPTTAGNFWCGEFKARGEAEDPKPRKWNMVPL